MISGMEIQKQSLRLVNYIKVHWKKTTGVNEREKKTEEDFPNEVFLISYEELTLPLEDVPVVSNRDIWSDGWFYSPVWYARTFCSKFLSPSSGPEIFWQTWKIQNLINKGMKIILYDALWIFTETKSFSFAQNGEHFFRPDSLTTWAFNSWNYLW